MNLKELYIRTFTGKKFYPFDPHPDQIDIRDIAAGLSKICRFSGQIQSFYSVAEHSVLVSEILPEELKLVGLLHDASEAYISDIAKPIKMGLNDYQNLETVVQSAIKDKFRLLSYTDWEAIKNADFQILLAEFNFFLPEYFSSDFPGLKANDDYSNLIKCKKPIHAEAEFLEAFNDLI